MSALTSPWGAPRDGVEARTAKPRGPFRRGLAKVVAQRRYLALAWSWNLVLALVLGFFVHDALRTSLGTSLAGERMRTGWDSLWYYSFSSSASGLAATFKPSVSGFGAVLDTLDAFLDGFAGLLRAGGAFLPVLVLYVVSWTFLGGGFLATFAAAPESRPGFLQRAARVFPRLLILAALGLAGYWLLLGPVRSRLDDALADALRDTIDERARFAWTLAGHAALWALVLALNLVLDYAKVLAVGRNSGAFRSALHALPAAAGLVLRHPGRTGALYLGTGLLWVALLLAYALVAPGASHGSLLATVGTFLLGQLYLFGRILVRCLFYASETVLCEALATRR